jgi:hypothetical protein
MNRLISTVILLCTYTLLISGDKSVCQGLLEAAPPQSRMVVLGDVHGSYDGIRENLLRANVTTSLDGSCMWANQPEEGTTVLQIGDMVDRGPGAIEAWRCLDELAETAPPKSEAVVLLGNHDLWWLKGYFGDRNTETDTKANIMEILERMRTGLASGRMRGAYLKGIRGVDTIFTHAGFRPEMLTRLHGIIGAENFTTGNLVAYMNDVVAKHSNCTSLFCPYQDELFEAGPDRGGESIGGPIWTDFRVLEDAAAKQRMPPGIMQVVGHSIADCFHRGGKQPMRESAECPRGLVRTTKDLHAICVDGGMFLGARAFLHVTVDGRLESHEIALPSVDGEKGADAGQWVVRDLADEACHEIHATPEGSPEF